MQVPTPKSKPTPVTLSLVAFFFSLLASYPAWLSYLGTPTGVGLWVDANFYSLVAGVILQLLGLATQILGPLLFPRVFHIRVEGEAKILTWIFSGFTFLCTVTSITLYGLVSVQWSGVVCFAGQAMMGLVQLMLVFGAS